MIAGFEDWADSAQLRESGSLDQLEDASIAIEAEYFIDSILTGGTKEPLLPALGGVPFTIDSILEERLRVLREHKIRPTFCFNGLNPNRQRQKLEASLRYSKIVGEAWDLYNASNPERAVAEFGTSCEITYLVIRHKYGRADTLKAHSTLIMSIDTYKASSTPTASISWSLHTLPAHN